MSRDSGGGYWNLQDGNEQSVNKQRVRFVSGVVYVHVLLREWCLHMRFHAKIAWFIYSWFFHQVWTSSTLKCPFRDWNVKALAHVFKLGSKQSRFERKETYFESLKCTRLLRKSQSCELSYSQHLKSQLMIAHSQLLHILLQAVTDHCVYTQKRYFISLQKCSGPLHFRSGLQRDL